MVPTSICIDVSTDIDMFLAMSSVVNSFQLLV